MHLNIKRRRKQQNSDERAKNVAQLCVRSCRLTDGKLLQVVHKHLQAHVVGEDGGRGDGALRIPAVHVRAVVVRLRRVDFGKQKSRLQYNKHKYYSYHFVNCMIIR